MDIFLEQKIHSTVFSTRGFEDFQFVVNHGITVSSILSF